jgi:hypothetical protein
MAVWIIGIIRLGKPTSSVLSVRVTQKSSE